MSTDLFDTIREIVRQEIQRSRFAELAVVQEQHPHADEGDSDNYSCTVALRDSEILLKRVPIATARKGIAAVPDVGDLVMVQFLGGDVNAPIITGSLYNDEDRPPANVAGEHVMRLPALDADDSAVTVRVKSDEQKSIDMNVADACKISITDDDPVINIDVGGSTTITVARNGDVSVDSGNNLQIKSAADMNIEAGGQLTLKGSVINLN